MMKKLSAIIVFFSFSLSYADVTTPYTTNPQLTSSNSSGTVATKPLFKSGWYAHKKDVTFIKLIQVGQNMGLSILFSNTGLFCPINKYLPFNQVTGQQNTYAYTVGNGCIATIQINTANNTFVMTVNSRSKCFEEYTYQEFCNGNLDVHMIDERASTYFVNKVFTYAKDQNDSDYDWNDD